MKDWNNIIVYIYLGALISGALGGLYNWHRLSASLRMVTMLLCGYAISELLSLAFRNYHNPTKIHHHILSCIEIAITVCCYLTLRNLLTTRTAIVIFCISACIVIISAKYIQPVDSINTRLLVFQGMFFAILSAHALFVLMKSDEIRILEDPQFWFWTALLMTNSVSVLHWGFFLIVEGKYTDLLDKMNTGHAFVNMIFYLLLGYAMIVLPRNRRFAVTRQRTP